MGLPLINQMMDDDWERNANEETIAMMAVVKTYAGENKAFLENVQQLLHDEGMWVAGPGTGTHNSPMEILEGYGINDVFDEDTSYACCRAALHANDYTGAVMAILDEHSSWGEFIGGVLASMSTWAPDVRERVMPSLERAVKWAAQHGVDH